MKRWDIKIRKREPFLNESPTGLVVFYSDHVKERSADKARIGALEKELELAKSSYRSLAGHHNECCVCMEIY